MRKISILILIAVLLPMASVQGQSRDTIQKKKTLTEVSVRSRAEGMSRLGGAENGTKMGREVLFRAACCNLGESFVANPSVDVNYSDAAVGARQIKLLGLSGQYVQMLIENLPTLGGAAKPYELGYVPGAWMNSISVSKGASSVKQGFQSITGQIDVEYLKPDREPGVSVNLFADSRLKTEANVVASLRMNSHLSTELLVHGEKDWLHHDMNRDGWHDSPAIGQLNMQNRWKYVNGRYIFHGGIGVLREEREGGQMASALSPAETGMRRDGGEEPFAVPLDADRYEAYMKHAVLLDYEHNTNIALMATASTHKLDGDFGRRTYSARHNDLYSRLIFEHDFNERHQLSAGASLIVQGLDERVNPVRHREDMNDATLLVDKKTETVPGLYAEYTYKPSHRLTVMAGLRADRSNLYGAFVTPRLHLKWMVSDLLTLRASTGKGYRSPHAWAENHYLLASGRQVTVADALDMEEAWNSGVSAAFYIPVGEQTLKLNAEYYYTDFQQQVVVDYDTDPSRISIVMLDGKSFSHTMQVDGSIDFDEELELTAAFRYNDVRCTYGGQLMEKPLTSRYKGLLTVAWKPYMGLWQVDVTLQLNGGGRMPKPYLLADGSPSWDERFPAYPQLNMQVTRRFRHVTVYVGGENLTNYRQPVPVVDASNPWSTTFEPTMVWGPVHGIMGYAGVRMNW